MFSRLNGVASKNSGVLLIELKVVQWSSIQIAPLRLVEASPPQCALQLQVYKGVMLYCDRTVWPQSWPPTSVKANLYTRLHHWTGRNRQWFDTFLLVLFGITRAKTCNLHNISSLYKGNVKGVNNILCLFRFQLISLLIKSWYYCKEFT